MFYVVPYCTVTLAPRCTVAHSAPKCSKENAYPTVLPSSRNFYINTVVVIVQNSTGKEINNAWSNSQPIKTTLIRYISIYLYIYIYMYLYIHIYIDIYRYIYLYISIYI